MRSINQVTHISGIYAAADPVIIKKCYFAWCGKESFCSLIQMHTISSVKLTKDKWTV